MKSERTSYLGRELIQNADDSGSTEIHLILDNRSHDDSGPVFSDSWARLQGPALLVKNDGNFSADDLKGISNLGTGSKREDSLKAGQYGVGFNCVYHLTDTPTFLANIEGEGLMLCAMDPRYAFRVI